METNRLQQEGGTEMDLFSQFLSETFAVLLKLDWIDFFSSFKEIISIITASLQDSYGKKE